MCFSDAPLTDDEKDTAKDNKLRSAMANQTGSNTFEVSLKEAGNVQPSCCCWTSVVWCGIPACKTRRAYLESFEGGLKSYTCCQGMLGHDCCIPKCEGSQAGLWCEGCCCPVLSLSITRLAIMRRRRLTPDPVDWQLIRCSNCLQMISCCCYATACILSLTVGGETADIARCAAWSTDCVADCFTASVGGCMTVQILKEIEKHESEKTGAPPKKSVMER